MDLNLLAQLWIHNAVPRSGPSKAPHGTKSHFSVSIVLRIPTCWPRRLQTWSLPTSCRRQRMVTDPPPHTHSAVFNLRTQVKISTRNLRPQMNSPYTSQNLFFFEAVYPFIAPRLLGSKVACAAMPGSTALNKGLTCQMFPSLA